MKHLRSFYLIFSLLCINICVISQNKENLNQEIITPYLEDMHVPTFFIGAVAFDLTQPEFSYSRNLNLNNYETIEFNIPFASSFSINGSHISFTISREEFMWRVYRAHADDGFWDIQIPIYYPIYWGGNGYINALSRIGILRVVFK